MRSLPRTGPVVTNFFVFRAIGQSSIDQSAAPFLLLPFLPDGVRAWPRRRAGPGLLLPVRVAGRAGNGGVYYQRRRHVAY